MRFDVRGMGDSEGGARSFEDIGEDIAAAAAVFRVEAGVDRCVLWGLCDAATAAIMFAPSDPSIAGVVALNPWARTASTQASARLQHYYGARLLSLRFWRRLLAGDVALPAAISGASRTLAAARSGEGNEEHDFLGRLQASWAAFARPVLLILAERDQTAREFEVWAGRTSERRALLHGPLSVVASIADADHTFSCQAWRDLVDSATLAWLEGLDGGT
jgi:exosortase A-associated hydrolase 1